MIVTTTVNDLTSKPEARTPAQVRKTSVSLRDVGADRRLALTPVRSVRLKGFTAIDVGDSIKQDGAYIIGQSGIIRLACLPRGLELTLYTLFTTRYQARTLAPRGTNRLITSVA